MTEKRLVLQLANTSKVPLSKMTKTASERRVLYLNPAATDLFTLVELSHTEAEYSDSRPHHSKNTHILPNTSDATPNHKRVPTSEES
jgi:hypothetical protein